MSRSKFPEEIDFIPELFDLPFDKMQDAERLTELKMQAALTNDEQNEVIRLSAELRDFLITPELFNFFTDALYATQEFFRDNVQGFIGEKQELWNTWIHNFKHIGSWKVGTNYLFQNMVINPKNGNLYLCKIDHVAANENEPLQTESAQWVKISNKGDKGDPGLSGILKGDWNATTNYVIGDAVCHGRVDHFAPYTYIAIKANVGKNPSTSAEDWVLFDRVHSGTKLPSTSALGAHFTLFV